MNVKLHNFIVRMSKIAIYAFIVCYSLSMAFATEGEAQRKMLNEIPIHLEAKKVVLIDLIKEVEKSTNFVFAFSKEDVKDKLISLKESDWMMNELLKELSVQGGLSFRRVNESINIRAVKPSAKLPDVFEQVDVQQTVRGKISDEDGEALPGATVQEKGTTNGTITDIDGTYTISVPENATLTVSFVGFKTQEISLNGRSVIDANLATDVAALDDVVVVGYGTVRKRDMTSAISQVSSKDIKQRVETRLDNALQGKMAGVLIQQSSGVPGAAPVIRIRGTNSITEGNQPLFVIDGMPVEDAGIIANINMNDVASVEVLKDAASAAIYGSRGSNGVVLITTKKGRIGKPQVSYNAYYGTQQAEKRLEWQTGPEWAELQLERREWLISQDANVTLNTPNDDRPRALRIDPDWATGNVPTYDPQDWIFRNAPIQSHDLSISGGSESTLYMASVAYLDQDGIIENTSFDRFSLRLNLETQVQKWLKVGLNLSPSISTQLDNNSEGKDQTLTGILYAPPVADLDDIYWNGNSMVNDYLDYYGYSPAPPRAMEILNNLQQEFKRSQILSNAYINVNLMEGLSFKTAFYYRLNNLKSNDYKSLTVGNGVRSATIGSSYNSNWTLENTLNYVKEVGKHSITGLLGYSSQKDYFESTSVEGRGFVNDIILTLGAAATINTWSQDIQEWSMLSSFARATYSYDSRYMLTASIRRDGSSRFGANNKWGFFPAVSAAWRIIDESFMTSQSTFSNLKVRASFGATGNNRIGNYRPYATLLSSNALLGQGGSNVVGLIPGSFENQDLSWEKNQTTNIGLDIGFMQDKLSFAIDAYQSLTKDLLLNVPVPQTTGFYSAIQNVGEVSNKGIEVEITSRNITRPGFEWNTSLVFAYNKNEVLKMGPDGSPIKNGDFWCRDCSYTGIGYPIGSFNLFETDGIIDNQAELDATALYADEGIGDVKWVDQNNDGVVNTDDRMPLGNPTPIYNFGITNTVSYKGFDLTLFINGAGGHETFFAHSRYISRPTVTINLAEYNDRWKSEAEPGNGIIPRVTSNAATNGRDEEQDRWLYDSDWWRIKNLTVGYNFPKSALEKISISALRLYVSGDNLLLFTKYPGFNPEGGLKDAPGQGTSQSESVYNPRIGQNQSPSYNLGMDFGSSPQVKRFIFGLNVTF